jgi:hypothetical protein
MGQEGLEPGSTVPQQDDGRGRPRFDAGHPLKRLRAARRRAPRR